MLDVFIEQVFDTTAELYSTYLEYADEYGSDDIRTVKSSKQIFRSVGDC
nr:MAG TPA: hypothetical protein [Caudoviricetes sp.]